MSEHEQFNWEAAREDVMPNSDFDPMTNIEMEHSLEQMQQMEQAKQETVAQDRQAGRPATETINDLGGVAELHNIVGKKAADELISREAGESEDDADRLALIEKMNNSKEMLNSERSQEWEK